MTDPNADRDHAFRECAERIEVKPGMYGESLCEACRIEAYSKLPDWAEERHTN